MENLFRFLRKIIMSQDDIFTKLLTKMRIIRKTIITQQRRLYESTNGLEQSIPGEKIRILFKGNKL